MGVAVRKNGEDELYSLPAQGAQVDINCVKLALIDLAPLTKGSNIAISDLIRKSEGSIAIVGFIHTVDQCLEAVT